MENRTYYAGFATGPGSMIVEGYESRYDRDAQVRDRDGWKITAACYRADYEQHHTVNRIIQCGELASDAARG